MNLDKLFFRIDPLTPWQLDTFGLPLFGLAALIVVVVTLWSYSGHAQFQRKRLFVLLGLRLLALLVLLLTMIRPTVGVQEKPKIPSFLLIGIDMSQSMTIPDELNNQPRIDAVRKTLSQAQPILDSLKTEQDVEIIMYSVGSPDFDANSSFYDAEKPADLPQTDYATYLKKIRESFESEPYVRGHLLIADGADNGSSRPEPEATRWRQAGKTVHTFAVGSATTDSQTKDVALISLNAVSGSADGSVYVKTDITFRVIAQAYGFVGARVPVRLYFDMNDGKGYILKQTETIQLARETENLIELRTKAPDQPGEIKVKVEIPVEAVVGDVAPSNNAIETYLNVTKEGMRVLVMNRLNYEQAAIREALSGDPRIDLYEVIRQTIEPAGPEEARGLDFKTNLYDVIVIGNISAKQLTTISPDLPAQIRDLVKNQGVGLLMTGGHATFQGTRNPRYPDAQGWLDCPEILEILPVDLTQPTNGPPSLFTSQQTRLQYLPTARQQDHYLNRLGPSLPESLELWSKLNLPTNRARFTGLSAMGAPKPLSTVFALAADAAVEEIPVRPGNESRFAPLLVGHQIGVGGRGRVLAFAAMDTELWRTLGRPDSDEGKQLHTRFWRQMIRWLANQDDESSSVFARPELPRVPVGGRQTVRFGLRKPGGAPANNPKFTVKIVPPDQDEASAEVLPYTPDVEGAYKVLFEPRTAGEHTIFVRAEGTDDEDKTITGEANARFFAFPTVTDELTMKAAKPEVLQRIANAGGGQFFRLEELPKFLRELYEKPMELAKPRPKYYPDWRREASGPFLPLWLVFLVTLLGLEWGLRRYWGLI